MTDLFSATAPATAPVSGPVRVTATGTDTASVPAPADAGGTRGWQPPAGIAPRGTLLLLPGRGEHPLVYERFGRRLSADGYVVHALDTTPDDNAEEILERAADAAGPEPVGPVVLVGSDTGALQALHTAVAAGPRLPVGGVVVAGAAPATEVAEPRPGPATGTDPAVGIDPAVGTGARTGADSSTAWDDELAARTACPAHRKRLTEDEGFVRGRLTAPVPARLLADARPDVPVLVLHGGTDPVTPPERARELAARLPRATLGVVREGRHDVLNDASHRTTAAVLVLWLERLRADPELTPILTVEQGAAL
ncbi:alpha/beta fold hydrolase [Streptomyces sp. NPDC050804]|uniref:alpha/beta hydrolase n=1 Tax=unclassified Streptomyces TaxID=2593676 RepID=UPI0034486359|nr:lysophospholipase [Streptomyces sp. NBC_00872]